MHGAPVGAPRLGDRYEVGPVLGHGGMGDVRAGFDVRLDRHVAIKILRADLARDRKVRAAFEREARAAGQLAHPSVVAVYDTGEQDGDPYIVMERLPGHTLADEIGRGPLDPARVRRLAVEVLGALQCAHDAGIVHRDVKPGNILLTERGDAKVSDFGIAKSVDDDPTTTTGPLFATLAYVAPERLAGERATAASDLYSVGVVVYEALTGHRPFATETPAAVLRGVDGSAALDEVTDPGLRAAIGRAMARDPRDRFASAEAMAASLDAAATAPVTTSPPTETAVLPSPPRPRAAPVAARPSLHPPTGLIQVLGRLRRGITVAAIAGAVVAALVLVGVGISSGGRDDPLPGATPTTAAATVATPSAPSSPAAGVPRLLATALGELDRAIGP